MADDLPGTLVTFTRDELVARYLRDFGLRLKGADTGRGSAPWVDAMTLVDVLQPLYANSVVVGNMTNVDTRFGEPLYTLASYEGLSLGDPTPATGLVKVTTSAQGALVQAHDVLKDPVTQLRFEALDDGVVKTGDTVRVIALDTGKKTNLSVGTQLEWLSPRVGLSPTVSVVGRADGTGFSGGAEKESDISLQNRIKAARRQKPASGNDAERHMLIENAPAHGVPVEKAFTYPGLFGPGSTSVVFTVLGDTPTTRRPTYDQIRAVEGYVRAQLPLDDAGFYGDLGLTPITLSGQMAFRKAVVGWYDKIPWPRYGDVWTVVGPVGHSAAPVPTATRFAVFSTTHTRLPKVGAHVALWDPSTYSFVKKTITGVTALLETGLYQLTMGSTDPTDDRHTIPIVGALLGPWSDSLVEVGAVLKAYFATRGPGEQQESAWDVSGRGQRSPSPDDAYPYRMDTDVLANLRGVDAVQSVLLDNASLAQGSALGVPGVRSFLMDLTACAFYAL